MDIAEGGSASMTKAQAAAVRASAARVGARAAELMVCFPEASVDECIAAAVWEEKFIYGSSTAVSENNTTIAEVRPWSVMRNASGDYRAMNVAVVTACGHRHVLPASVTLEFGAPFRCQFCEDTPIGFWNYKAGSSS